MESILGQLVALGIDIGKILMTPRFATAAALLEELAIDGVEEIDVEAIAHYCGATVVYEALRAAKRGLLATVIER